MEKVYVPTVGSFSEAVSADNPIKVAEKLGYYVAEALAGLIPDIALTIGTAGAGAAVGAARGGALIARGALTVSGGMRFASRAARFSNLAAGGVVGLRQAAENLGNLALQLKEDNISLPAGLGTLYLGFSGALSAAPFVGGLGTKEAANHMMAKLFGSAAKPYLIETTRSAIKDALANGLVGGGMAGLDALARVAIFDALLDDAAFTDDPKEYLKAFGDGFASGGLIGGAIALLPRAGRLSAKGREAVEREVAEGLKEKAAPSRAFEPSMSVEQIEDVNAKLASSKPEQTFRGIEVSKASDIIAEFEKELSSYRDEVESDGGRLKVGIGKRVLNHLAEAFNKNHPVLVLADMLEKSGMKEFAAHLRDAENMATREGMSARFITEEMRNTLNDFLFKAAEEAQAEGIAVDPEGVMARVSAADLFQRVIDDVDAEYDKLINERAFKIAKKNKNISEDEALELAVKEVSDDIKNGEIKLKDNPYGLTQEKAQDMLSQLERDNEWLFRKRENGKSLYEEFRERFNQSRARALDHIARLDPALADFVNVLKNNKSYATYVLSPFDLPDALVQQFVGPSFASRTGWAGGIRGTIASTIAKMAALEEAAVRNYLTKLTVEGARLLGLADPARLDTSGKPVVPRNADWELVTVRIGTEPKHFYLPTEIARALDRGDALPFHMVQFLSRLNAITHGIFIKYSPSFVARNWLRDIADSFVKIGEFNLFSKDWWRFLRHRFGEARREAQEFVDLGVMSKDLQEAIAGGHVTSPLVKASSIEAALGEIKDIPALRLSEYIEKNGERAVDTIRRVTNRAWDITSGALSLIPRTAEIGEIAGKLALYKTFKGKVTDARLREITYNLGGTPNFLRRGKAALLLNAVLPLSNVRFQGWRAFIDAVKEKPGATFRKLLLGAGARAAVKFALVSGAALKLYESYFGSGEQDDDPERQAVRDVLISAQAAYERIPSHMLAMYDVFPLGVIDGKAMAIRVPEGQAGEFFGALIYHLLDTIHRFSSAGVQIGELGARIGSEVATAGFGELPGFHPLIKTAADLALVSLGVNPPDFFRGGPSVPRRVMEAGKLPALRHQALKDIRSGVGPLIGRMLENLDSTQTGSLLRELYKVPGLGAYLGSLIVYTDAGIQERLDELSEAYRIREGAVDLALSRLIDRSLDRGETIHEALLAAVRANLLSRDGRPLTDEDVSRFIRRFVMQYLRRNTRFRVLEKITRLPRDVREEVYSEIYSALERGDESEGQPYASQGDNFGF